MTFVPKHPAQFIRPIRDNIKRIIERDQAEVIAEVQAEFGLADLPPIIDFKTAFSPNLNLPAVTILPAATQFDIEQDGRKQQHGFMIEIQLSDADLELMEDQGLAYIVALDRILTTAKQQEYWQGAQVNGAVYEVLINKHDYGTYGRIENNILARNPKILLVINSLEA